MADFPSSWQAEVLAAPPMIAPARQFVWPMLIAGEEDALARGALRVMVRPRTGGAFLLTCALGFRDPSMPSGVWSCPDEDWICCVAGGYGYLASTLQPAAVTLLTIKPVVSVLQAGELLLFIGFQTILAWGSAGLAWESARLSWEGVRVVSVSAAECIGFGWDLVRDREVEFRVRLADGSFTGGAWSR